MFQRDTKGGIRYCTGDNEGVPGRIGCGVLTREGAKICKCGQPTRPPAAADYVGSPEGAPEQPTEEMPLDIFLAVSELMRRVQADASGSMVLTSSEEVAMRKALRLSRSAASWWADLVRVACDAHNRGISDGFKAMKEKRKHGR